MQRDPDLCPQDMTEESQSGVESEWHGSGVSSRLIRVQNILARFIFLTVALYLAGSEKKQRTNFIIFLCLYAPCVNLLQYFG